MTKKKKNKKYDIEKKSNTTKTSNYLFLKILLIIVLNIIFIPKITNNQFYKAFHYWFQLVLYVLLFNSILFMLANLHIPFFKPALLKKIFIGIGILIIIMYIISFLPVLDMNGDNAGYMLRSKSIIEGKGFRDSWVANEPYTANLKSIGFSILYTPLLYFFKFNIFILKLLPTLLTFLFFYFLYYFYK